MPHKQRFDYFQAFEQMGQHGVDSSHLLYDVLSNFDVSNLLDKLERMHEIENASDVINHKVYTRVAEDFVTPIEREDILQVSQELDNVVDRIEAVLQYVYILNIQQIMPSEVAMSGVIVRSAEALHSALCEFESFKKSKTLKSGLVEVNTLEEEGDRIFLEAMRHLHTSDAEPIDVINGHILLEHLERTCDACEHAANAMETVMMKNS